MSVVLGNLLWVSLSEQGFGLDDLQRLLPTLTIMWFYDITKISKKKKIKNYECVEKCEKN